MNKAIVTLAIASSLAVSLSAFAAKGPSYSQKASSSSNMDWHSGWYIGAGINGDSQSVMDLNSTPDVFNNEMGNPDKVTQDGQSMGFDVFVGRQVNQYFGAELGYTYLSTVDFTAKAADVKTYKAEVDQWNVHLVGVGKLPVGEYVNVFGKGGVAYFSTDQKFKNLADGTHVTDTAHTFALTYGAGLEVAWDNWGIRGEYNVIWPANNVRDDFYISDIISANLYYKFM